MGMEWTNSGGGDFEQAPTGNHVGQLIRITDLGTQTSTFEGKENVRRQVLLTWELPEELRDDGKPFVISKFYTMSLGEKANLTKDLISWLGKAPDQPFDPTSLMGKGCTLSIIADKNDKHKVAVVTGLGKKDTVPETTVNEQYLFSLDAYDEDVFEKIGKGIQNIILKSPEYAAIVSGGNSVEDDGEQIPF